MDLSDAARSADHFSLFFARVGAEVCGFDRDATAMVREVVRKAGFRIRAAHRLGDFIVEPGSDVAILQSGAGRGESTGRIRRSDLPRARGILKQST